LRVTCVTTASRGEPDREITEIGGVDESGGEWKLPRRTAIQGIKDHRWVLYVELPDGSRHELGLADADGRETLMADRNAIALDGLLGLPRCPW
jgi:hypothetical protein